MSKFPAQGSEEGGRGQLIRAFTMGRADFAAYEYLVHQSEAKKWIESVLGETFPDQDLHKTIFDGVVLCQVGSAMFPDDLKKWNGPHSPRFKLIENIELFISLMEKNGVAKKDLFGPLDLFEKKNMPQVLHSLHKFADGAQKKGFTVVWEKSKNNIEFSPKEIQEAKKLEGVTLWSKGGSTNVNEEEKKKRDASLRRKQLEERSATDLLEKLQAEQEAQRKREEEERKIKEEEEERKRKEAAEKEERRRKREEEEIELARQKKQKDLEESLIKKRVAEEEKRKNVEEEEFRRKKMKEEEEEIEREEKYGGKKNLNQIRTEIDQLERQQANNEYENTSLHMATEKQLEDVVRYLIKEKKVDPNVTNANNDIPLHVAVQSRSLKIVDTLIEGGSNVNTLNRDGDTPLHKASAHGSTQYIKVLLEKGADVNGRNLNLETPLLLAVSRSIKDSKDKTSQLEIVSEFIKRQVDVNAFNKDEDTALHVAAAQGNLDLINELAESKKLELNSRNKRNATPLQVAAENEHSEVVKRLLELGADLHTQRNDGWSPLYTASYNGDLKTVSLLLSKGADVDGKNDEGWSPLHAACAQGHLEITKLMVRDYKAKVNVLNEQGTSPLFHAVSAGRRTISDFLVEKGDADVDLSREGGWKPLHAACYNEFEKLTNFLVTHGAALSAPCKEINNYTPLHILISTDEPPLSLIELLVKKGARLNIQNSTGGTPLHLAAFWGHYAVIKLLADEGADLDIKNEKGRSALDLSALYGHRKIAEYLAAKMKKPLPDIQDKKIKTKEMSLPTEPPAPKK